MPMKTVTGRSTALSLTVCIAEDRASCEPALRVLVASLAEHCPGLAVEAFCPNATASFTHWLNAYPDVRLNPRPLKGVWTKYDIKPQALIAVLEGGAEAALWIDSDIIVTRDFRPVFENMPKAEIAVTEEALSCGDADEGGLRARLWGFKVGRTLPSTANTGVVRVTQAHIPLLEFWNSLLQRQTYRDAQNRPWHERNVHVMGDQEVLTAILASADFAHLPIKMLKRGPEILQFFGSSGYTLSERLRHLFFGLPYFIHSQGVRPWWPQEPARGARERFAALYQMLSPYLVAARRYASVLDDSSWLYPTSTMAASFRKLGFGSAPLTGIGLAAAADAARAAKKLRLSKYLPGRK